MMDGEAEKGSGPCQRSCSRGKQLAIPDLSFAISFAPHHSAEEQVNSKMNEGDAPEMGQPANQGSGAALDQPEAVRSPSHQRVKATASGVS